MKQSDEVDKRDRADYERCLHVAQAEESREAIERRRQEAERRQQEEARRQQSEGNRTEQARQDEAARSLKGGRIANDTARELAKKNVAGAVTGLVNALGQPTGTVNDEGQRAMDSGARSALESTQNKGVKEIQSRMLDMVERAQGQTLQRADRVGLDIQQFRADLDRSQSEAVKGYEGRWGANSQNTLIVKNYEDRWGGSAQPSQSQPSGVQPSQSQGSQTVRGYESRWGSSETTITPSPNPSTGAVRDYENKWGSQPSQEATSRKQVVQNYEARWGASSGSVQDGSTQTRESAPGCDQDAQCQKCQIVNQEYRARGMAHLAGRCELGSATPIRKP